MTMVWNRPTWMTVGAQLIARDGRLATITAVNPNCHYSRKPVEGVFEDGQDCHWMLNGSFWLNGQKDRFDLVGPAPTTIISSPAGDHSALLTGEPARKWEFPDVVFLSAPCKGFSGILPEKSMRLSVSSSWRAQDFEP